MADLEPAELFAYGIPLELAFADAKEIRDAFTALAQSFYTTDVNKPLDARNGQIRVSAAAPTNSTLEVFLDGAWRVMIQQIDKGIPSPVKQIVQFNTATTPWVINHNLGSQVVACVYDASFIQLKPVNVFAPANVPLVRVDASLALGAVMSGFPIEFDGNILSTFAVVEGAPLGAGTSLDIQLGIDKTASGGGLVPVSGGLISLLPAAPTGAVVPGNPVTGANVFVGTGLTPDVLEVSSSGTPLASGFSQIWAKMQHTLNPGEYRLTQVNDNRITIDHAGPIAGFVVLVG